eukprot:TRINITY_DN4870_c0_g1_i1.p1 TRINITY_DN4870_c0_g1~~TRINITY_DN4870_c0_g1_i1.p1  ORF type:complete len:744 (+),score=166.85 TRINITY_DN4870_c0_g1_i1:192-2423(+)
MADGVEFYMEQMIPGLEELQTAEIFTAPEIKAIVKKRRDFEYAIARPGKTKVDFFRYLEYEFNLDSLRKKRVERLGITKKNGAVHCIRHITSIFVRCLRKFKGDSKIWLQFIDYCTRIGSVTALNRTFAEALQYHSTNHKLWILAASWEYEHNLNISAARTLLQRALRTLPKSQELYLEYCRMELMYREKIRKRMELMGIDQAALKAKSTEGIDLSLVPMKPAGEEDDEDQQPEEEDDGMKELLDLPEGDPAATEASNAKPLPSYISSSTNPFFEGAIILVVYNAAIAKIPSDISFRQKMLSVVQAFPDTKKIQDEIYASLERDFPENEDVLILIARRPLDSLPVQKKKDHDAVFNATRETLDNIDNELLRVDTASMRQKYIETLINLVNREESSDVKSFLSKKLQSAFQDAIKSKQATESIFLLQIRWLLESGKLFEALDATSNAVKHIASSASLWVARLKLLFQIRGADSSLRIGSKSVKDYQLSDGDLIATCEQAVKSCKQTSEGLWTIFAQLSVVTEAPQEKILQLFTRGAKQLKGDELDSFKQRFLELSSKVLSSDNVRKFYEKAFEFHPTKLEFYSKCIEYENSQVKIDVRRIRQLYEYAITEFGKDNDNLWLEMIKWELGLGHMEEASSLYWRAKKTLNSPDNFVVKHSVMMNSEEPETQMGSSSSRVQESSDEDEDGDSEQDSDEDSDEEASSEEEEDEVQVETPAKRTPAKKGQQSSSPRNTPSSKKRSDKMDM